jgi:hypothetical protein
MRRRVPKNRKIAWLSYRAAIAEMKSSRRKIQEWFSELQHYGFIVLHKHGSLGVEGKGKAPHYRLTELGCTRQASTGDEFEPPTRDFLSWDGVLFEPKRRQNTSLNGSNRVPGLRRKQKPVSYVGNEVFPTGETVAVPTSETPFK